MKPFTLVVAGLGLAATTLLAEAPGSEPTVQSYETVSGVSGMLNSVGSDTMNNLMTLWSEAFIRMYPGVKVKVEGRGSATAPQALITGTAQLGPMSRLMEASELQDFERRYGYAPIRIRTSLDALAVYVNQDNPVERLTFAQLDAVFSETRKRGARAITTWGQLGLEGDWAHRPIHLFGRNSASGTYAYFREHVLAGGRYKTMIQEQPGSAAVVQGIAEDRFGIGYSGIGYRTSQVKNVALSQDGSTFSSGSIDDVASGRYPLARYLYIYVNRKPGQPLDPLVREFLKFVLSREGQEIVVKDGYLREPAIVVAEELAKLA